MGSFDSIRTALSLVGLSLLLTPGRAEEAAPPNFVVILADDLGYGDLGAYGGRTIRTPRIDRMAAEGVRLTEFYSAAPTCTPARVGLLTGRYPYRTGLTRVLIPKERWGLPAEEVTLAEALRALGYRTACIGKWHLGGRKPYRPERHGFDEFYGVLYSNDMTLLPLVKWPRFELLDGAKVIQSPAKQAELTKNYTVRAIRFIEENRERPFFLYLPYSMPHAPAAASKDFHGKSAAGAYGDAVEELDWNVGRVLDALAENGLDERTLVVFTSDNGPWFAGALKKGRKIQGGSGGPFRGGKGTTWEGGQRVPMIVRQPGPLPSGAVRDGLVTIMDLFPTFVHMAGGEVPKSPLMDGRDIYAFLKGKAASPHRQFFYFFGDQVFAVRQGAWKAHFYRRDFGKKGKLKMPVSLGRPELYNLADDPGETRDVAAQRPELAQRLASLAREFHASITPAMRLPGPRKGLFQGLTKGAPKRATRSNGSLPSP